MITQKTDKEWKEIKDEQSDRILKAQCLNIAFQNTSVHIVTEEIKSRIKNAKEIYYEIKKEDISRW